MVLSFLSDMRSMAEELLSSGFRKSMQSMNPPDGKLSSNIMISLISSVSSSLLRICPALVQNVSVAVLSAAYAVEHLSEMMLLTRSNPIFCSKRWSICILLSSKTFQSYYLNLQNYQDYSIYRPTSLIFLTFPTHFFSTKMAILMDKPGMRLNFSMKRCHSVEKRKCLLGL